MTEPKSIELSEMIETLRVELLAAQNAGKDEPIRFEVESAEIEVQFAVQRVVKPGAKIKLHVIEAGGEAKFAKEAIQKVTLRLKPKNQAGDEGVTLAG